MLDEVVDVDQVVLLDLRDPDGDAGHAGHRLVVAGGACHNRAGEKTFKATGSVNWSAPSRSQR